MNESIEVCWWFYPTTLTPGRFWKVAVTDRKDPNNIIAEARVFSNEDNRLVFDSSTLAEVGPDTMCDILSCWEIYKTRPEFAIIDSTLNLDNNMSVYDLTQIYDNLLLGSMLITAFKRSNGADYESRMQSQVSKCLEWLHTTDFYTCPASTQYHDSNPSGLLIHSLNVCREAIKLLESSAFQHKVNVEDAVFTSLVHDWCKIGLYTSYVRNVKDESTGQWAHKLAYKYVDNRAICLGHGVSSMFLAMRYFNVSIEVAAAIRYHMGRWNCVEAEVNELQQANHQYPLVHLIQFADQLSIVDY